MDFRKFTEEEKEMYLKRMYDFCIEHNWDIKATNDYSMQLDLRGDNVRDLGRLYIKKYMGLSDDELEAEMERIKEITLKSTGYHRSLKVYGINELLAEEGIQTDNLWNNETQKKKVLEYIYEYCQTVEYDRQKVEETGKKLGVLSYDRMLKLAKMYATEYLKVSPDDYETQRKKIHDPHVKLKELNRYASQSDSHQLYNALLNAKSVEEEIEIIENSRFPISYLIDHVRSLKEIYNRPSDYEILKEKLAAYAEYKKQDRNLKKEQRKETEKISKLDDATGIISKFLSSSLTTIDAFCRSENIDKNDFNKYLGIIEEKNSELFDLYKSKVEKLQSTRYMVLLEKSKKMINEIKNGVILENNVTRPFDVVDYFGYTRLSYEELFRAIKKTLTPDEVRTLRKFTSSNTILKTWDKNDINKCYESKHIVGVKFDDKMRILDPGHEVTRSEKENIINYIREHHIPLCQNTYSCILNRYFSGYLNFDDKEDRLQKKNS